MKSNTQMGYGALAIAGLCLLLGSVANAAPTGKIEICHKPGERNQRILSINEEKDGAKHYAHGDYEIATEMCDDIADNNCDGIPGTAEENDATCLEGATCVAGVCVAPPVECPCDYQGALNRFIELGATPPTPLPCNTSINGTKTARFTQVIHSPYRLFLESITDPALPPTYVCFATVLNLDTSIFQHNDVFNDLSPAEFQVCEAALSSLCNGT